MAFDTILYPCRISAQRGFTLIELSIVLVIIGLIVGSVLVGQDLIHAAQVRATMRQSEEFIGAANTFHLKYNALPSDIPADQAAQLGFFQYTGPLSPGSPAGDSGFLAVLPDLVFWRHLSDAQLIPGNYGSLGNSALDPSTGFPATLVTTLSQSVPPAKVGNNIYFFAGGGIFNDYVPTNYFFLLGATQFDPVHLWDLQSALIPTDAMMMDTKMDDGLPVTGRVRSISVIPPDSCYKAAGAGYVYNPSAPYSSGYGGCELIITW